MKFSPFNPIRFYNVASSEGCDGNAHIFAESDYIIFEVLHRADESLGRLQLIDARNDAPIMDLSLNTYQINMDQCVSFYEFRGLEAGEYRLLLGEWLSNRIIVTNDLDVLQNTVLFQYSTSWNDMRSDFYAKINGSLRYFEARLYGGFKDSGWRFSVENEQFETDESDIIELYAMETTEKELTIGKSSGYPKHVGESLSHILSCEVIFIDGDRYSYSGNTEIEESNDNQFIYKVTMRKAKFVNVTFERDLQALFRKAPANLRKVNGKLRKL